MTWNSKKLILLSVGFYGYSKGIKQGQLFDGIEGDTAFDEEKITPMTFDDDDQADFSEQGMIAFKEVK